MFRERRGRFTALMLDHHSLANSLPLLYSYSSNPCIQLSMVRIGVIRLKALNFCELLRDLKSVVMVVTRCTELGKSQEGNSEDAESTGERSINRHQHTRQQGTIERAFFVDCHPIFT